MGRYPRHLVNKAIGQIVRSETGIKMRGGTSPPNKKTKGLTSQREEEALARGRVRDQEKSCWQIKYLGAIWSGF